MLVLEIEYLTGVAVAASAYDRTVAEWPPHPDRIFSALVCAWAEGGEDATERAALEWLETLDAPEIVAPEAARRETVDVFVPPNDMTVSGKPGSGLPKDATPSLAVLPVLRRNRQARQFPAMILPKDDRRVRLVWRTAARDEVAQHRGALAALARAVPYLGHSSSLVRLAFLDKVDPGHPPYQPDRSGELRLRVPSRGRLNDLVTGYASVSAGHAWRPSRTSARAYKMPSEPAPDALPSVFGREWIVLADAGGETPALEAFAVVARALRDALMAHADDPVAEALSGHAPDANPSRDPHLAIVPLADVGWRYSSGRLMGVGLVLPRKLEREFESPTRRAVLRAIARFSASADGESAALTLGALGVWCLRREPQPDAQSLRPERYCRAAARWATVTPFVFDRFPKDKEGQDAGSIVVQACVNIGLPSPVEIALHKHSAFRGAPSSRRHRGEPPSAGYKVPKKSALGHRPLQHLVLTFEHPVRGPVILGAGRFLGLGLCLPLDHEAGT